MIMKIMIMINVKLLKASIYPIYIHKIKGVSKIDPRN